MKDKFVNYLKEEITAAYGDYPAESPDFARIETPRTGTA
jgi:aldehyde dehydrogenase (NAD+)